MSAGTTASSAAETAAGGGDRGGTWGRAGYPGGGSPRGSGLPGSDLPTDRGGWGHDQGNTSTTIDPSSGDQSASVQWGSLGGGPSNLFLNQLTRNPGKLAFLEVNQGLRVSADELETECVAATKVPISDSYGDGERSCGWAGRAWVIETKRGSHFKRSPRLHARPRHRSRLRRSMR